MLRRRDPEDPFHASLQLRLTEPSHTGEIGNPNRLTEVILDVPHDLTQTPGPDVGIGRDDQIAAHRNQTDQGAISAAASDRQLGGQVPAQLAIRSANQLKLVEKRLARSEHFFVLLLEPLGQLGDEVIAGGGADHLALRRPTRPADKRAVDLDITPLEVLGAKDHVDQRLEQSDQLWLTGEQAFVRRVVRNTHHDSRHRTRPLRARPAR